MSKDNVIYLNKEDFERFLNMLENPPAPTEALKELMRATPPWDKEKFADPEVPGKLKDFDPFDDSVAFLGNSGLTVEEFLALAREEALRPDLCDDFAERESEKKVNS